MGARSLASSFKLWWLLLNTSLIVYLLSRRISGDLETSQTRVGTCRHHHRHRVCDPQCTPGNGVCLDGVCACNKGWSGEDCSSRVCYNDCNENGLCLNGTCVCNRRYTGEDCSVDVAILKEEEIYQSVSDKIDKNGKIDRDIEHFVNTRAAKKYHFELCRSSKACQAAWLAQMLPLLVHLPRDDVHLRYPSCAIVSSGKNVVYNGSSSFQEKRTTGRGEDIDKHRAIFRLNNAPTENFEKWVGKRTTHRLVEADYAQMVQDILGTEVTVNRSKSIVTPTTFWAGGYPHVEKVTYLMAVYPSKLRNQMRAPETNGYSPYSEIFPGNRRYLFSPHFMNEVKDIYGRFRETIKGKGLGCYKAKSVRVPQIFTALMYSMQVCSKVHIYGLSQTPLSALYKKARERKLKVNSRETGESCCYYEVEGEFSSRNPICDELTKNHIIRILMKTNKIFLYD